MKVRLTIMTENNVPRPEKLTENMVVAAWQTVLEAMLPLAEDNSKVTVESAEFI